MRRGWLQPLTALTGSPKQIAWAEQIRAGLTAAIAQYLDRAFGTYPDRRAKAEQTMTPALVASALSHTDSRWWIDNRGGHNRGVQLRTLGQAAWNDLSLDERTALKAQVAA